MVTADDIAENVVQLIQDDQPILARERVNHVYEPIALVACADPQKLARALERTFLGARLRAVRLDRPARHLTLFFKDRALIWRLHPPRGYPRLHPAIDPTAWVVEPGDSFWSIAVDVTAASDGAPADAQRDAPLAVTDVVRADERETQLLLGFPADQVDIAVDAAQDLLDAGPPLIALRRRQPVHLAWRAPAHRQGRRAGH